MVDKEALLEEGSEATGARWLSSVLAEMTSAELDAYETHARNQMARHPSGMGRWWASKLVSAAVAERQQRQTPALDG